MHGADYAMEPGIVAGFTFPPGIAFSGGALPPWRATFDGGSSWEPPFFCRAGRELRPLRRAIATIDVPPVLR